MILMHHHVTDPDLAEVEQLGVGRGGLVLVALRSAAEQVGRGNAQHVAEPKAARDRHVERQDLTRLRR